MNSTGVSVTGRNEEFYRDIAFGTYRFHSLDSEGKLVYAKKLNENETFYISYYYAGIQGGREGWVVRF